MTLQEDLSAIMGVAVEMFIEDARTLVSQQFSDDTAEIAGNDAHPGRTWLKTRKTELAAWLKSQHPLSWGSRGAARNNYHSITRFLASSPQEITDGLPHSSLGSCSRAEFVAKIFKMAFSETRAGIRPPIWSKGSFWVVLRTAMAEGLSRIDGPDADSELQAALMTAVSEYDINFFPDSPNRGDREPSYRAWTMLGLPDSARRSLTGTAARTAEEQWNLQLAKKSQAVMNADVHASWVTTEVEIQQYHRYMKRQSLPSDFDWRAAQANASADPKVAESYHWADGHLRQHINDWECRLALHLAFLLSKMLPRVFATKDDRARAKALFQNVPSGKKQEESIAIARSMAWSETDVKGLSPSHYFSQAVVFFSCWVHEESPVRQALAAGQTNQLKAWNTKHSKSARLRPSRAANLTGECTAHKGLGAVNMLRMGIVEGKNNRVYESARSSSDYVRRSKDALEAWYHHICARLKDVPDGPYELCLEIFGQSGTAYLLEQSQFRGEEGEPRLAGAARARGAASHSPEIEDETLPRPAKRRRVS